MRNSSSTSSSRALALSWVFCAALVGTAEVVLHLLPADAVLAFDQHSYALGPTMDFRAVNRVMASCGKADMIVIGNSRARELLVPEVLREELRARHVPCEGVRNYACAGARAPSQYVLLRRLQKRGQLPRVVIYGADIRQLCDSKRDRIDPAYFMEMADLFDARLPFSLSYRARHFPDVVLSSLDRRTRTLWLRELILAHNRYPGTARGGASGEYRRQHQKRLHNDEDSLLRAPIAVSKLRQQLEQLYVDGGYRLGDLQKACARQAVRLCVREGCRVVVVELPMSGTLRELYPRYVYEDFLRTFRDVCADEGARFVALDELGLHLGEADFLDESHPNWSGATKFTRAFGRALAQDAAFGRAPEQ